jgi:hypothetical protein
MEKELNYKVQFISKDGKEETIDVKAPSEEAAFQQTLKIVDVKPEGILKVEATQELEPQVEPENYNKEGAVSMNGEKDLLNVVEESMNSIFSILKDASLKEELGDAAAEPVATEEKTPKSLKVTFSNSKVYPDSEHQQSEDVTPVIVESMKELNVKASKMFVGILPERMIDKMLVRVLTKTNLDKDAESKKILSSDRAEKVKVLRNILDKSLEQVDKKKVADLEGKAEEALKKNAGLKESAGLGLAITAFGSAFVALFSAVIASWDIALLSAATTTAISYSLNKKKTVFESEEVVEVEKSVEPEIKISSDSIVVEIPLADTEVASSSLSDKELTVVGEALRVIYSKLQTKNLNESETVEIPVDAEVEVEVENDKIVIEIPTESPKEEVLETDAEAISEALTIISALLKEEVSPVTARILENSVRIEIPVSTKGYSGLELNEDNRSLLEDYLYSVYASVTSKPLNEEGTVEVSSTPEAHVEVEDDRIVVEIPVEGAKDNLDASEEAELKEAAIGVASAILGGLVLNELDTVMPDGGGGVGPIIMPDGIPGLTKPLYPVIPAPAVPPTPPTIPTEPGLIQRGVEAIANSPFGQYVGTIANKFGEAGANLMSSIPGVTVAELAAMTPGAVVAGFGGTLLAAAAAIKGAQLALKSRGVRKFAATALGMGKDAKAYKGIATRANIERGQKQAAALKTRGEKEAEFAGKEARYKQEYKDAKRGGRAIFNLPFTQGRKRVSSIVANMKKGIEDDYTKAIAPTVDSAGNQIKKTAAELDKAEIDRAIALAGATRGGARQKIRSDAEAKRNANLISRATEYDAVSKARADEAELRRKAEIESEFNKKAGLEKIVNASVDFNREFLFDLFEYTTDLSAKEAQVIIEQVELEILVEAASGTLTSKGYSLTKEGLKKYVTDNKLGLSESVQSDALKTILAKGQPLVEGYTSLKEAFLLEADYFDKDSVDVVSSDEKKDKLAGQMALLVARDSHDPLYDELLNTTVQAKKLHDELKNKYGGLGRDKAVSLFTLKASNPIEPVSTVIPFNPEVSDPHVPNAEVALADKKSISSDIPSGYQATDK